VLFGFNFWQVLGFGSRADYHVPRLFVVNFEIKNPKSKLEQLEC
jgi:hypothetical protein